MIQHASGFLLHIGILLLAQYAHAFTPWYFDPTATSDCTINDFLGEVVSTDTGNTLVAVLPPLPEVGPDDCLIHTAYERITGLAQCSSSLGKAVEGRKIVIGIRTSEDTNGELIEWYKTPYNSNAFPYNFLNRVDLSCFIGQYILQQQFRRYSWGSASTLCHAIGYRILREWTSFSLEAPCDATKLESLLKSHLTDGRFRQLKNADLRSFNVSSLPLMLQSIAMMQKICPIGIMRELGSIPDNVASKIGSGSGDMKVTRISATANMQPFTLAMLRMINYGCQSSFVWAADTISVNPLIRSIDGGDFGVASTWGDLETCNNICLSSS